MALISATLLLAAAGLQSAASPASPAPDAAAGPVRFAQLRIERRIILRVPRQQQPRRRQLADLPTPAPAPPRSYREEPIGKCIEADRIASVRPVDSRGLDIFTRDARRIRARLAHGCSSVQFYSGFYIEKPKDGKLCVGRDILHARSGAKCRVERFRLLVLDD